MTGIEGLEHNTALAPAIGLPVPVLIAAAGERVRLRFIDFFTAHIRNPNTRAWLDLGGLTEISAIRTHHVSTYVELLTRMRAGATKLYDCRNDQVTLDQVEKIVL
jgi:hypothetical protein